jgi:hypothetical protein
MFLPPDEPQAAKQERHDGEFTGVRPMQPECAIPHGKTLYTMLSIWRTQSETLNSLIR